MFSVLLPSSSPFCSVSDNTNAHPSSIISGLLQSLESGVQTQKMTDTVCLSSWFHQWLRVSTLLLLSHQAFKGPPTRRAKPCRQANVKLALRETSGVSSENARCKEFDLANACPQCEFDRCPSGRLGEGGLAGSSRSGESQKAFSGMVVNVLLHHVYFSQKHALTVQWQILN